MRPKCATGDAQACRSTQMPQNTCSTSRLCQPFLWSPLAFDLNHAPAVLSCRPDVLCVHSCTTWNVRSSESSSSMAGSPIGPALVITSVDGGLRTCMCTIHSMRTELRKHEGHAYSIRHHTRARPDGTCYFVCLLELPMPAAPSPRAQACPRTGRCSKAAGSAGPVSRLRPPRSCAPPRPPPRSARSSPRPNSHGASAQPHISTHSHATGRKMKDSRRCWSSRGWE